MKIDLDSLKPGWRAFAREQAPMIGRLQRALDIVHRGRPDAPTVEMVAETVLLRIAHAHARRTERALEKLAEPLNRILADVEASRRLNRGAVLRDRALRESDLREIKEAIADVMLFQDRVKRLSGSEADEARRSVAEALSGTDTTALNRESGRAKDVLRSAGQISDAWRAGRTLEEPGTESLRFQHPGGPELVQRMDRLRQAVEAFHPEPGTDVASLRDAINRLQSEVEAAHKELNAAANAFQVEVSGAERVPPSRAAVPGTKPISGSDMAKAQIVRGRLRRRPQLVLPGSNPDELFDALMFHPIEAGATGTLRDPVPRLGLEKALPDIAEIAGWVTDPPELAGRLAALFHEWQRAHEVGAGFGGEFAEGLMLASWGVNQEAQNRGIEKFLRAAHDREFRADVTIKASGRRLAIPLADGGYEYVDVLTSVVYGVHAKGGKTVPFGITMEPSGRWHVTHRLPAGTPGADVRTRGTR